MSRTRLGAAAAGIAAAVVLSACSTGVAGQPVAVQFSATTTSSSPEAQQPLRWKNVEAEAPELDHDSVGARFGPQVYPGIGVTQVGPDKSTVDCSAGPAVTGGVVVAAHCDAAPGGRVQIYPNAKGSSPIPVGVITDRVLQQVDPVRDFALLRSTTVASGSTVIAGRWAIAGVLTEEAAPSALPVGSPVCVNAAYTGIRCGAVLSTDDDGELLFNVRTEIGDSGAAVFAVSADTGAATLIGIVRGGDETTSTATYLAPALDKLNVSALVDPTASANTVADSRYSRMTTPTP
ncbi:hypothetical protein ABFV47_27165 [Mycolicibacterium fortuitum]|uniref:hypothetical protein n=1 Tax=Mycolicibacterium fortuitum TaxID=1766 RepID=UPI0007EB3A24|nr:hypothetical protein [Mycolicibacterium fortuitum]OBG24672.1 hypothetical protein A5768_20910 [Mycolicibacterium fortuitum]